MARPKEKETVMTKQGKRTYKLDRKTGKKLTGRKPVIDEAKTKQLEELFSLDLPMQVVCAQAGISDQTYYNECNRNPEFFARMERAKHMVHYNAGRNIARAIEKGDKQTSKRYFEHRDERFKSNDKGLNGITVEKIEGIHIHVGEKPIEDKQGAIPALN